MASFLLVMLFASYQACCTLFSHTHTVNGVTLVHSHPYSNAEHTHTNGQMLTLSQITQFVSIEQTGRTLTTPLLTQCQQAHILHIMCIAMQWKSASTNHRGPPSFSPLI